MPRRKKKESIQVEATSILPSTMANLQKKKEVGKCEYIQGRLGNQAIKMTFKTPIKHRSPYLGDGHLSIQITGASGTGKSTFLVDLIPNIDLSQIAIFSRIQNNPVNEAIEKYCNANEIEYFFTWDVDTASEIVEEMISKRKENDNKFSLLIFDDFTNYNTSRNDVYQRFLNTCNGLLRNYQCHTCFITQSAMNVSTLFRTNTNVKVLFRMNEKYSIQSIKRDFMENFEISSEQFDELYKLVKKVKHSYLMLSNNQKLYIYIHGEMDKPQEVCFSEENKLEDDSELNRLCQIYTDLLKKNKGIMNEYKIKNMRDKLNQYLEHLSKNIDGNEIRSFMRDKYNLNV